MNRILLLLLILISFSMSVAFADETTGDVTGETSEESTADSGDSISIDPTCPDNELFSEKLISDISWKTAFPMRISGAKTGDGDIPDGAADTQTLCYCVDNQGVPDLGYQVSLYKPSRLVDVVRNAWCAPSLGGIRLTDDVSLSIGDKGNGDSDMTDKTFYHYNYYSFPLFIILDLFVDLDCNQDGYMDMDLMYLSPVDPTYADDELAFLLAPESAWAATPAGIATQIPDCLAVSAGTIIDDWFWTAGCWGNLYPLTGNIITNGSPPRDSNLIATRALAGLHRRGLERLTMGNDAMCENPYALFIPKNQYRWSMFYPVAEVDTEMSLLEGTSLETKIIDIKGYHLTGESQYLWGEWRNIPATGEDFTFVLWNWTDCCMR